MTESSDGEEWRKKITTELMKGSPFIVIDNLKQKLNSGQLQSALTTTLWKDRLLGTNQDVEIEPRCVWIATGNNPEMDGETARRTVRIRMDAGVERPYLRGGFKHNLKAWSNEHRGELTWAALTLWQAWLAAGRPKGNQTLGTYESWVSVMGGVLDVAGIEGFMANAIEFYEEKGSEEAPWHALVESWAETHGGDNVTGKELRYTASGIEYFESLSSTSFGNELTRRVDRVYGNYKIRPSTAGRSKAKRYRLVRQDESQAWPTRTRDEPPASGYEPLFGTGAIQ